MQGMRLFHWYLLLPVSPFIETENNNSYLQRLEGVLAISFDTA